MDFMTGLKRTDYCGDLRIGDVGKEVVVAGFTNLVKHHRNHPSIVI